MENTVNLKSSIAWSDFKLNSDGMVPVIAQDYQTNEVLMLSAAHLADCISTRLSPSRILCARMTALTSASSV